MQLEGKTFELKSMFVSKFTLASRNHKLSNSQNRDFLAKINGFRIKYYILFFYIVFLIKRKIF